MKDREFQKIESQQEYARDRLLVDDIVNKIREEDMNTIMELNKKKEVAKSYMYQAYEEKEQRKKQQKEVQNLINFIYSGRKITKRKGEAMVRRVSKKRWRAKSDESRERRRKK